MKTTYYISFNIARDSERRVRDALARAGCDQWCRPAPNERGLPSFENLFDFEDARLHALLELTAREGIKPFLRVDHIYTDAELRACPFLRLIIARAEIGPFGPKYGTTYDLASGCGECGSGAVQTSPFYAPASALPKTGLVCCSSTEAFVAEPVVDALRCAEVTGLELRQVQTPREHSPLPWWQIIPKFTMAKVGPATKGLIQDASLPPCPRCRRDCHCQMPEEPEELAYSRAEVNPNALPDVVQTWERFGRSVINREDFKRSRFAEPAILIKPSVFDILRKLKVKQVFFTPVRVV